MDEKQTKALFKRLDAIEKKQDELLKRTDPKRQRPVEVVERPQQQFIGRR